MEKKDIRHRSSFSLPAILLVVLFASYYCGSTFFVHSHNTWHGLVTHSHPYFPNSTHTHTDYEFDAIAALNDFVAQETSGSVDIIIFTAILAIFLTPVIKPDTQPAPYIILLRGPPSHS